MTGGCKGLHWVLGDYRWLQGVTKCFKGLDGFAGVTGFRWGYRWLHGVPGG